MIENDPINVSTAFEMLLEEVEAEIDFVNNVGAKAFETMKGFRQGRGDVICGSNFVAP